MKTLDALEELLSLTFQFKDELPATERDAWLRISAETADLREAMDQAKPGVFRLQEENPDSAYCRLSKEHELIVHRSDEGIVLDVWKDGKDQDGPVFTTYFFDDDLMPDEDDDAMPDLAPRTDVEHDVGPEPDLGEPTFDGVLVPCQHEVVDWDSIETEYQADGTAAVWQQGRCTKCGVELLLEYDQGAVRTDHVIPNEPKES